MNTRSKGDHHRINYKVLNSTGERVTVVDSEMALQPSIVQELTLSENIIDYIEENEPNILGSNITDIDTAITKIEDLRIQYRNVHNELKLSLKDDYEERYSKCTAATLRAIREYIVSLKKHKRLVRDNSNSDVLEKSQRKTKFMMDEIKRILSALEETFSADVAKESDTDVKRRKGELDDQQKDIQTVSTLFKDIIDSASSDEVSQVNVLNLRYEKLLRSKTSYTLQINKLAKDREFDKQDAFKTSLLNIKLTKFKGYNSVTDIYTFKSDFEKLYMKSTPSAFLPDLLKNNFLENPALLLVKNVNSMEEIWKRLKEAYGHRQILLSKKLNELTNMEATWKQRDPEKVIEAISKIVNVMKDLLQIAQEHNIENTLFYSDTLSNIYKLLGDNRLTRWLSATCDDPKEGREQWDQLVKFLEKEIRVHQQKLLIHRPSELAKHSFNRSQHHQSHYADGLNNDTMESVPSTSITCSICGAQDHAATNGPNGTKVIQYFACRKFVNISPLQRFQELKSKGFCFQCLFPGAKQNTGKHKEGRCQRDFTCKHSSHDSYASKKHVLVCDDHKRDQENKDILEHYKARFIMKQRQVPSYSKDIHLSFHAKSSFNANDLSCDDSGSDKAIYMLQTIDIEGKTYTIFYDTGCSDFVSRYSAIQQLGMRAEQECAKPTSMGGVGGIITESMHGTYRVNLPLFNGNVAVMTGVCMDRITPSFPFYPLHGKVESDIHDSYQQQGGDVKELPTLPSHVGGDIDFMIGIKYLRYFPEKFYQLPSGLTIYNSIFRNADGSFGVIGGPHEVFTEIEKFHHLSTSSHFIKNQLKSFQHGYDVNPDLRLLGYEVGFNSDVYDDHSTEHHAPEKSTAPEVSAYSTSSSNQPSLLLAARRINTFNNVEAAGSEINYRCVNCRSCSTCKNHSSDEIISIKEKVEQDAINKSVIVDIKTSSTIAFVAVNA